MTTVACLVVCSFNSWIYKKSTLLVFSAQLTQLECEEFRISLYYFCLSLSKWKETKNRVILLVSQINKFHFNWFNKSDVTRNFNQEQT